MNLHKRVFCNQSEYLEIPYCSVVQTGIRVPLGVHNIGQRGTWENIYIYIPMQVIILLVFFLQYIEC